MQVVCGEDQTALRTAMMLLCLLLLVQCSPERCSHLDLFVHLI